MSDRLRSAVSVLGLGLGIFVSQALYTGNERFYREVVMPLSHIVVRDGERAHKLALKACELGIVPRRSNATFPDLQRNVFGLHFDHPVGLAAGFDKDGDAALSLLKAGFSFVEVGSVTPLPQSGNPRPRIFRWESQEAVINRCGFNSEGHDAVYEKLKNRPWAGHGIVGVNLGCNKTSTDPIEDYVLGVRKFGPIADYLVINVSSPNTPDLRMMQQKEALCSLLDRVLEARNSLQKKTPVLLKISPDESDQVLHDIVDIALHPKTRVDGIIVSNTTLATYDQAVACGAAPVPNQTTDKKTTVWGGLSGRPLRDKSTACLKKVVSLTKGQLPLIAVGGISEPTDAIERLEEGASLVQLYTSMIYQGPPVAHRIANGLSGQSRNA
ncbi:Dihydroorotate dehydrogenase [Fasciola gigantica]|uniref:Dihydroorotate dehydrogenase (quinone), mitochondrial n=1 Tax=Fasciola gigantica TaxID=46835 RepID=A0A504YKV3_FASGI|nr:Dihydroorotate dehydrogenase [Fasciola gigantica]